jgi:uroporphyrin-III C-methyltransferase
VYLIGAGPGDPELLTRKALRCLQSAEVVLHDALVPDEIVRLASPQANIVNTGKRCGVKSVTQQEINALMISYAEEGKTVVRLKGGDPLIFGRAGEEIAALKAAGVEFEIIPGVTAASAAAAAAQITLTNRHVAPKLIFVSAHASKENERTDWKALATGEATLAIYMPGGNYQRLARELQEAGLAASTPCVIVSQAFRPRQLILRLNLDSLAGVREPAAPAILLVGEITRGENEIEKLLEQMAGEIDNIR